MPRRTACSTAAPTMGLACPRNAGPCPSRKSMYSFPSESQSLPASPRSKTMLGESSRTFEFTPPGIRPSRRASKFITTPSSADAPRLPHSLDWSFLVPASAASLVPKDGDQEQATLDHLLPVRLHPD